MYEGSMVGSGAIVFALMGYIIANYKIDREVGAQVRLNPTLLSTILGEDQKDIQKAIHFLCSPDPNSTTKTADGRRLIKIGEFDYQVVNGAKYHAMRNEEERRESNRLAKQRQRAKDRKKEASPLTKEPVSTDVHAQVRNFENGLIDESGLPTKSERPVPSRAELMGEGV